MTENSHIARGPQAIAHRESASTVLSELRYAGGTLLVDENICAALFDYAVALSDAGRSAVMSVRAIVDGVESASNILLGPGTQLWCAPAEGFFPDISDADKVREIRDRISGLTPQVAVASHFAADHEFEYGL